MKRRTRKIKTSYRSIKIIIILTMIGVGAISFIAIGNDLNFSVQGHKSLPRKSIPVKTTKKLGLLIHAIATKEGYYNRKNTLAKRNNNAGNLVYVGQKYSVEGSGGFAHFDTPQHGIEALQGQIERDAARGHTLATFIHKYAPPHENDTAGYVSYVSAQLNVSPSTPLKTIIQ